MEKALGWTHARAFSPRPKKLLAKISDFSLARNRGFETFAIKTFWHIYASK
jgi:hypothetical protein